MRGEEARSLSQLRVGTLNSLCDPRWISPNGKVMIAMKPRLPNHDFSEPEPDFVDVWSLPENKVVATFRAKMHYVRCAWSPDSTRFALGNHFTSDFFDTVKRYDVRIMSLASPRAPTLEVQYNHPSSSKNHSMEIVWSPDSRHMLTSYLSSEDVSELRLIDTRVHKPTTANREVDAPQPILEHRETPDNCYHGRSAWSKVTHLRWSSDGCFFFCCAGTHVKIWRLSTEEGSAPVEVGTLVRPPVEYGNGKTYWDHEVRGASWVMDSRLIIVHYYPSDATIVWDAATLTAVRTIRHPVLDNSHSWFYLSPGARYWWRESFSCRTVEIGSSTDDTIRRHILDKRTQYGTSLEFSPNNLRIAMTFETDNMAVVIKHVDAANFAGDEEYVLTGHKHRQERVRWIDNETLATFDKSARMIRWFVPHTGNSASNVRLECIEQVVPPLMWCPTVWCCFMIVLASIMYAWVFCT